MKIKLKKIDYKLFISRLIISLLILTISICGPLQMVSNVAADQYDDKIVTLQKDIAQYEAEGTRLNAEAATLQSALAQISNQKAAIQAQVDISQTKYDQLIVEIADTEKKIKDNQDALGVTIANLYVDDNITPVEILFGSKNISDYMDKQEYRNSIRDELTAKISEIKVLKVSLDAQKVEVEKVLAQQKSQRDELTAKENEQQNILNKTKGDEAVYQQLINNSRDLIAEAKAVQAAINASINNTGGGYIIDGGLLGDYPWNYNNCPMWGYLSTGGADGNGGDGNGYGCRQCASYVAWKIAKETNFYPKWGNAVDFTANAQARFGAGDGQPHAGSIAVMDAGKAGQGYGHVAWVETEPYVNNGRTVIQISQYNYDYGQGYGMYSRMELSVNAFDHYVQIVK